MLAVEAKRAASEPDRQASWLYARDIVDGVIDNREAIDEQITTFAKDWSLQRMPAVDRALLRIGAWRSSTTTRFPRPSRSTRPWSSRRSSRPTTPARSCTASSPGSPARPDPRRRVPTRPALLAGRVVAFAGAAAAARGGRRGVPSGTGGAASPMPINAIHAENATRLFSRRSRLSTLARPRDATRGGPAASAMSDVPATGSPHERLARPPARRRAARIRCPGARYRAAPARGVRPPGGGRRGPSTRSRPACSRGGRTNCSSSRGPSCAVRARDLDPSGCHVGRGPPIHRPLRPGARRLVRRAPRPRAGDAHDRTVRRRERHRGPRRDRVAPAVAPPARGGGARHPARPDAPAAERAPRVGGDGARVGGHRDRRRAAPRGGDRDRRTDRGCRVRTARGHGGALLVRGRPRPDPAGNGCRRAARPPAGPAEPRAGRRAGRGRGGVPHRRLSAARAAGSARRGARRSDASAAATDARGHGVVPRRRVRRVRARLGVPRQHPRRLRHAGRR